MPWRNRNYAPPVKLLRLGMAFVPVMVAGIWAWQLWSDKYQNAVELSRQNAALIGEYVMRSLHGQSLLLNQIDRLLQDEPDIEAYALHRRLNALDASTGNTTSVGVIDANGDVVAGSRTFPLKVNLAHREFFQVLRDGHNSLVVERLVQYPSERDTITVARRLTGPGLRGVVTASAGIAQFTDFLSGISAASNATAFLLRADGKLLVRPDPRDPPFMMLPDGAVMTAISKADHGVFYGPGRMDGVGRIYAYRKIDALPLYAIYGISRASLVEAVVLDMIPIVAFLLLSSALGYVALTGLVKRVEAERARREAEFDRQLLKDAQQLAKLKETMLKEMSHRVHNNLQMVQSLIQLRRRSPGDTASVLQEIGQRVWAISEVHNLLYGSSNEQRLDLGAFLRTMANNPSIVPPEQAIAVNCDTEKVEIGLSQAVPAALIVLEALTNALKHAFPRERQGVIDVSLRQRNGDAEIIVADNGVGLPDIRARNSGLKLNQSLAAQLHGEVEIAARRGGGTVVTLRFPLNPDEGVALLPAAPTSGAPPVAAAW